MYLRFASILSSAPISLCCVGVDCACCAFMKILYVQERVTFHGLSTRCGTSTNTPPDICGWNACHHRGGVLTLLSNAQVMHMSRLSKRPYDRETSGTRTPENSKLVCCPWAFIMIRARCFTRNTNIRRWLTNKDVVDCRLVLPGCRRLMPPSVCGTVVGKWCNVTTGRGSRGIME